MTSWRSSTATPSTPPNSAAGLEKVRCQR
jgi:hypothetical protein